MIETNEEALKIITPEFSDSIGSPIEVLIK